MRMVYQTDDGASFQTAEAAREHERSQAIVLLVGMSEAQLRAALDLKDTQRAGALEAVGLQVRTRRLSAGMRKRAVKVPRRANSPTPQQNNGINVERVVA